MSPLILFSVCALLPVVFSADVERIQKAIEVHEQNAKDHKVAAAEIRKSLEGLGGVYKSIISNLTVAKGEVSNETQTQLAHFKSAAYTLAELRETEALEEQEVKLHQAILRKVTLAHKWLTQDLKVFQRRKKDKDDQECHMIETLQKVNQRSRSIQEDDEERILKEELRMAESESIDAAEEKSLLQQRLDKEKAQWKQEVESTFKVINHFKSNLAGLKSICDEDNRKITSLERSIAALRRKYAILLVDIRTKIKQFRKGLEELKSFHSDAECYQAVRSYAAKLHEIQVTSLCPSSAKPQISLKEKQ